MQREIERLSKKDSLTRSDFTLTCQLSLEAKAKEQGDYMAFTKWMSNNPDVMKVLADYLKLVKIAGERIRG
jgi:hypothetical protein